MVFLITFIAAKKTHWHLRPIWRRLASSSPWKLQSPHDLIAHDGFAKRRKALPDGRTDGRAHHEAQLSDRRMRLTDGLCRSS